MLSGSYYISEPLRRTQPNKAAVEGDYIVVVNISGVKSKEGEKLLRLKSSVDAGTYGIHYLQINSSGKLEDSS